MLSKRLDVHSLFLSLSLSLCVCVCVCVCVCARASDVTEAERERVKSLSLEDILAQAGRNATTNAAEELPPSQQPITTPKHHPSEVSMCYQVECNRRKCVQIGVDVRMIQDSTCTVLNVFAL